MARKKTKTPKPITSTKHKDKRANIPTEELRDFVAEDETSPEITLYPRDPSLDPQLVWKGKDAQDGEDLAVAAVPVYIQEKIHPQAIIEDVRAQAKKDQPEQLALFADFNGLEFEELIEFYQHEQNWANRLILGDSLLVMTSLAEKEGLKGQVQMIYIDPPYGIKFGSNWQVSTRQRQVRDGKAEDVTRQPEQVKAFRDTWELGIHSYLAYLRDRLVVARELLTESGSVFVQIGDENVHLVRCLLDEVFGSENFVSAIVVEKTGGKGSGLLDSVYDTLLLYAKNKDVVKYRPLFIERKGSKTLKRYNYLEKPTGETIKLSKGQIEGTEPIPEGRRWGDYPLHSQGETTSETSHSFVFRGEKYYPKSGRHWTTTPDNLERLDYAGRIVKFVTEIRYKRYADDFPVIPFDNIWTGTLIGIVPIYVVQTATKIVERCVLMTTDPGDLVLDPTCGSGTNAYVAEQWGRRWITVDTSRVALALARTRLMTARYPYYLLADSPEGIKQAAEIRGQVPPAPLPKTNGDVRQGFVYRQVPHITLRDIARNEEIDAIYEKWQAQIELVIQDLSGFGNLTGLQAWEFPHEPGDDWPQAAKDLLQKWWELRRARQKEIDASIARHSASETLYDQPYEDRRKLRVSGPFTVESLSPHRVLTTDEERPASEVAGQQAHAGGFEVMIIENLKKAGAQNTIKNERLKFDRLEPYAGEWIQAEGEYTEISKTPKTPGVSETPGVSGVSRRVAVAIGPEHGTVGPQLLKEAAKEAVRGLGFDLLIVCGFAFDPHVAEETRRYGNLNVLTARMNPDLAMGDTLLKKTGSGNLFMIFGEPDVEIRQENGKVTIEIKGLDIYDPTTGEIRASSTHDIACWFIDTNYNEESFFVRHAYFTGADKPYEKLKRALRAEINEAAWSALYATVSRPFDPPETGKIAVKVINHYGDEVLKVYEV
jgi:adenine-specific DNA-methyltransferase